MLPNTERAHERAPKSLKETVYEALVYCFGEQGYGVTIERLCAVAQLPKGVVNNNLKTLMDEDKRVQRIIRGVYAPLDQFPAARAITKTALPSGAAKLEIGDECIMLTPHENRLLTSVFSGGSAAHESEALHQTRTTIAHQAEGIKTLHTEMASLIARLESLGVPIYPKAGDRTRQQSCAAQPTSRQRGGAGR